MSARWEDPDLRNYLRLSALNERNRAACDALARDARDRAQAPAEVLAVAA